MPFTWSIRQEAFTDDGTLFGAPLAMEALLGLYLMLRDRLERYPWFLRLVPLAILLPYVANTAGWVMTEVGGNPGSSTA